MATGSRLEKVKGDAEFVTLCRKFLQSKADKDADSALDYLNLNTHLIPDESLETAMDTLMVYSGDSDPADALTSVLLGSLPAKRALANALKPSPTGTFNKIF